MRSLQTLTIHQNRFSGTLQLPLAAPDNYCSDHLSANLTLSQRQLDPFGAAADITSCTIANATSLWGIVLSGQSPGHPFCASPSTGFACADVLNGGQDKGQCALTKYGYELCPVTCGACDSLKPLRLVLAYGNRLSCEINASDASCYHPRLRDNNNILPGMSLLCLFLFSHTVAVMLQGMRLMVLPLSGDQ